jgi:outer membrane protein assembly factor BamB
MNSRTFRSSLCAALCAPALVFSLAAAARAQGEWPQWGGPGRDFVVKSKGLRSAWPAAGPKRLWTRELGEGHSGIVADGGTLYTMFGRGAQESVVAIDAKDGRTKWEYFYSAPADGMNLEHGRGPHSTPLVVGPYLYAVGATGKLHAFDKKTAKVVWSHDLVAEFGGRRYDRGYAPSPIAYKQTIIVPVGGAGQSLMAFDQRTGAVVWKGGGYAVSQNSPTLIKVDGQDQLVFFAGEAVVGVEPSSGEVLWQHPHKTDWGLNISGPVWGPDNVLVVSSAYSGGSRALKLARDREGKTAVTELWAHKRFRVHHGTMIRLGDYVYGSSGDFGPAFVAAVDVKTGEVLWQDRSFAKANFLYADGKLILLDEDGQLALATASPQGLKVLARAPLLKRIAWTAPTLVGTKLYVRDRQSLVALELGG